MPGNALPRIRVMLSSRSISTAFSTPIKLETLRRNLQQSLQTLRWSDRAATKRVPTAMDADQLFDVWIHEDEPAAPAGYNILETSLREIQRADIIIVLYTGEAGSADGDHQIGICHAEMLEAMARRGDVVYIIELIPLKDAAAGSPTAQRPADADFQRYVSRSGVFRVQVNDEAELQEAARRLLQKAVADLVHRGASRARRRDRGQQLEWASLSLAQRRLAMRESLARAAGVLIPGSSEPIVASIELAGQRLRACLDAIPDSLGVAAARELLGQPIHRDHLLLGEANGAEVGIVHLVACYRSVTEGQAKKILGTPDAVGVSGEFGVYVADHVQQIQLIFLAQCGDEGSIALAMRRLEEWLSQTAQIEQVVDRASGRRKILLAIREVASAAQHDQAVSGPTKRSRRVG